VPVAGDTVVAGPDGSCLVIDPAMTPAAIAGLAAALSARGLRPAAGWSTHPHWDHVLWHASVDPRAAQGYAREMHEAQLRHFRR